MNEWMSEWVSERVSEKFSEWNENIHIPQDHRQWHMLLKSKRN